jgi:hypothetical protein
MESDSARFLRQLTEAVAETRRKAGFPEDIGILVEEMACGIRRIVLDPESARAVPKESDAPPAERAA